MSTSKKVLAGRIQESSASKSAENQGADRKTPAATKKPSRARKAAPTTVRTRPVRVTVDLAPHPYRQFTDLLSGFAESLGVARVPQVEVIRLLVDRLVHDQEMQDYMLQRLIEKRDA